MPSAREVLAALHLPDSYALPDVPAHAADAAVLMALESAWELPRDDFTTWEAGVRNRDGHVYRRALLKGVAQVLYFEEQMAALGFVPQREDNEHQGSGFDIIFRAPGQCSVRPASVSSPGAHRPASSPEWLTPTPG